MRRQAACILLALACSGCALAARDHACWPFLARQYHDRVPSDVVRTLARERGTQRRVGVYRAPLGHYWRRRRPASLRVEDIRTLMGKYELARCPNAIVQAAPANAPALPPAR